MSETKRFAFNLETVLQYRTRKEEEAVAEQAGAEARRRQKEGALARTRATLAESLAADARTACRGSRKSGSEVGVAELLHTSVYHVHLNRLAVHQATEVEEAAQEWALCRERTLVLHRERQVLEKLKERKKDEFFHQLGIQEQKENDEISLRLHTARNSGH